ncbi:MAG: SAM-dependent chlorinase/fluorinase [Bacteroidota bacterium]
MNSDTPIITLTTDYGIQDYYVALLKASLLRQLPKAQIIDISHHIPPHDIVKAAYILKNSYQSFPKNSIHLVCVNNRPHEERSLLLTKKRGQYFIVPDNGLLSLLFEEVEEDVYAIPKITEQDKPLRNLYATATRYISEGGALKGIGQRIEEIEQRITLKPVITASQIRGSVIHIDHYENVVVNISKSLFDEVGHGRSFELFFKRHDPISKISQHYNEVGVGEVLCLFNETQQLEIAISMGKAASLLGLHIDDTIQIDFKNVA